MNSFDKLYFIILLNVIYIFFRVVFNANKDEPQKLIIRPAGVEPGSENDNHIIDAETQASYEGISVTPYGKIEPGTYDFYWNGEKIASEITLPQGGVHTFVVNVDQKSLQVRTN